MSQQHHARTGNHGKVATNACLHPLVEPLRRGKSNLEQLPQNFQHPKDSAGPKSPTPVFLPIKSHTAFLFLPPRELPTLTAAAARAEQHQSPPPCIPALPRPLTTSRPLESLLAAVRKREKKAQPNHQLATIPTRTPVAKTPQLTRPQVSPPSRTCPIAASPSKTTRARTKANRNPRCAADHATRDRRTTPSQCPTRRRKPSPHRRRRRARSPGPSARRFSTRRSVLHPRADPAKPLSGVRRSIDKQQLTSGTVGLLPVQRHHQVLPRPRLRRRLLGAPVQAEGVAGICGRRVRRGAGV